MYKQNISKLIIYVFSATLLVVAIFFGMSQLVFAHGSNGGSGMMSGLSEDGHMMMRDIEDQMVTDEVHEEMETLMDKMMSGTMNESERTRMLQLMQDNQIVGNMMMGRMMNGNMMESNWTDIHHQQMARFHSLGYMAIWWIFGILSLIFLVLANFALIRWLKK